MNMFDGEKGPPNVDAGAYSFHTCPFYWVPTYGMHPFDSLYNIWEFVDVVGHPIFSVCGVESVVGMVGLVDWGRTPGTVDGVSTVVYLLGLFGQGNCP